MILPVFLKVVKPKFDRKKKFMALKPGDLRNDVGYSQSCLNFWSSFMTALSYRKQSQSQASGVAIALYENLEEHDITGACGSC